MQKVLFAILISVIAISLTAEAKKAKRSPASIEGPYSDCTGTLDEEAGITFTHVTFDFANAKVTEKSKAYTITDDNYGNSEIIVDTIDLGSVKLQIESINTETLACPVPKQGSGHIDQICSVTDLTGNVSLINGTGARPIKKMRCSNHIARNY